MNKKTEKIQEEVKAPKKEACAKTCKSSAADKKESKTMKAWPSSEWLQQKSPEVMLPRDFLRYGRDSNPRPPAWQAGILTSWTTTPLFWMLSFSIADAKVDIIFESASVLNKNFQKK